jgi:hypothetical protein
VEKLAGTILSDHINTYFYLFVWFFMTSVRELNCHIVYMFYVERRKMGVCSCILAL